MIAYSGKRLVGGPKRKSGTRRPSSRKAASAKDNSRKASSSGSEVRPAQAPVGYRNGNINNMSVWGGQAPTAKASAQATILQYAGLCGGLSLILFLLSTLLRNSKGFEEKNFLGITVVAWLYIKAISYAFGFVYGLAFKCYWRFTDFQGRSKMKLFFSYLVADFLLTVIAVVSIVTTLKVGEASSYTPVLILLGLSAIFTPCELVKLQQIVESETIRKSRQKMQNKRKSRGQPRSSPEGAAGTDMPVATATPLSSPKADLCPEGFEAHGLNSSGDSRPFETQPSAPPPEAMVNEVKVTVNASDSARGISLMRQPHLPPEIFEQLWLSLAQVGGLNQTVELYPDLESVKMHLEKQSFVIVASGLVGEGKNAAMRTFFYAVEDHQFASRSIDPSVHCIFLAEFIVSWRDSHPQCSATFKCTHPGLVDDFAEHIQLEGLFGK